MEASTWAAFAAVLLACISAAALIYLVRKQIISANTVEHVGDLLDSIEITGSGFTSQLFEYARMAVHAVEQLAKNGEITKGERKDTALSLVDTYALIDSVDLTDQDKVALDSIIEAAVSELPKSEY